MVLIQSDKSNPCLGRNAPNSPWPVRTKLQRAGRAEFRPCPAFPARSFHRRTISDVALSTRIRKCAIFPRAVGAPGPPFPIVRGRLRTRPSESPCWTRHSLCATSPGQNIRTLQNRHQKYFIKVTECNWISSFCEIKKKWPEPPWYQFLLEIRNFCSNCR